MNHSRAMPSPDVRVRFDRESGDDVVDIEVEVGRAASLIAAVAAAAREVRAVIQRLELRPRRAMPRAIQGSAPARPDRARSSAEGSPRTVGARIHLASDRAARLSRGERHAMVAAVLAAIESTLRPQPALVG